MNFEKEGLQRGFLVPLWCNYDSSKTITIGEGDSIEWNGSKDLSSDLVLERGAKLTMHCMVSMAPRSKIILNDKATLILDDCTLTTRCKTGTWQGILIPKKKKNPPVILLKNGSSIQKSDHEL